MPGMTSALAGACALSAFLASVAATAWIVCGPRTRTAVDAAVGVAAWSAALIVSYSTLLSVPRLLTASGMLALAALVAAGAWGWRWARRGSKADAPDPTVPAPPGEVAWWLAGAAPIVVFVVLTAHTVWRAPETGSDNLAYHLPRLGYWLQQQAVAPFVAGNARAGSFPPNGNVLQLVPVLFLRHDRFCGLVQLAAAVFTSAALYGIARGLGATAFGASLAALCWFGIPCVLEQAARSMVDVTASFFVAATVFFLVRGPRGAYAPITGLACSALAIGTKTPAAVFALPLAAACAWRLWRDRPRALAGVAGLGLPAILALGGSFHIANARVWSDASGPASIRWVVLFPSLASLGKNAELVAHPFVTLLAWRGEARFVDTAWAAATGYGFGLGWLALSALTGILLAAGLIRRSRRRCWPWAALWALGCGGALALCFALRHQDAVLRFLLPAAALVTPTFAWTFDRLAATSGRRCLAMALAGAGVSLLLWRWEGSERFSRRRDGRDLARSERFGPDLEPLAATAATLDLGPRPHWGLLTPDYFPEGVFFGPRYRNRLVPLSYEPPRNLGEIERLGLDALFVDTRDGCSIALFRREFARPVARPQQNRRARPDSYDEDFVRAYGESVLRVDLKPTVRALADPSSGWGVVTTTARGALFVKGRGDRVDVARLCGTP